MFRITPKEEIFFDFFVEIVKKNVEASRLFYDLLNNYEDIPSKVKEIEVIEHDCDAIVHKVFRQLDASFITPIDREDIHLIAKELDDITDQVELTAQRSIMYNVDVIKDEAIKLASENGIEIIMSTPSFELWYRLHYSYTSKVYSSNKELINDLKNYIPVYKKSLDIYDIIKDKTDFAVNNSKRLEKEQIENGKEINNISCNPYTAVYKPVEYMLNRSK